MKKILIYLVVPLSSIWFLSAQTTSLNVRKVTSLQKKNFQSISTLLESEGSIIKINTLNWEKFSYKPEVFFRIAHDGHSIYLKFYVSENHILAKQIQPNSATHRDSCVEFFIDPDQKGYYYNFEFNCIGTIHLAYGPNRKERTYVPSDRILNSIYTASTLGTESFEEKTGDFKWEMVVAIPKSVFIYHPNLNLKGLESKANFYKCGDDTQKPHYLSWVPIYTAQPDFHRPEYFGTVNFN
jgi:hypothetical protein